MNVITVDNADAMSEAAAHQIAETVENNPDLSIVPAMGSTPMGAYARLVEMQQRGAFDASRVRVVQLDEYLDVPRDDDRSLYGWLDRSFRQPLGIAATSIISFEANTVDAQVRCRDFDERVVAAGGIDLAVLGLGPNGHLGFNEPPSHASSPTRVVSLTEESIVSNAAYWGGRDRVPLQALTLGMDRLLAAKHILLLVSGSHKRGVLQKVLHGAITPDVPASYLRQAANVTMIADRAALPNEE
jgi:glucosamine-6-phosphate deaminase